MFCFEDSWHLSRLPPGKFPPCRQRLHWRQGKGMALERKEREGLGPGQEAQETEVTPAFKGLELGTQDCLVGLLEQLLEPWSQVELHLHLHLLLSASRSLQSLREPGAPPASLRSPPVGRPLPLASPDTPPSSPSDSPCTDSSAPCSGSSLVQILEGRQLREYPPSRSADSYDDHFRASQRNPAGR